MSTDLAKLHASIEALIAEVRLGADKRMASWRGLIERETFEDSAANLAAYLALRHRDLRPLQRKLMIHGLSSLGRLEGRVMPTLLAVRSALAALLGRPDDYRPSTKAFFAGERRLAAQSRAILGSHDRTLPVSLLVTCPSEAADDPGFMLELAKRRVEAVRINCAHDDEVAWARMIGHLRAASATTGHKMKVFMDLAGPKIRTGEVRAEPKKRRVYRGDVIAIVRPGGLDGMGDTRADVAVECTLPEALDAAKLGDRLFVDDGKIAAEIEQVEPWGALARVTAADESGARIKPEKALNFPDTALKIDALTDQDRADLSFVAAHADGIGYSFVRKARDVRLLQDRLSELRPKDWQQDRPGAEDRNGLGRLQPAGHSGPGRGSPAHRDHDRPRRPFGGDRLRAHRRNAGRAAVARRGRLRAGDLGDPGAGDPGQDRRLLARRDDRRRHGRPRRVRDAEQGPLSARSHRPAPRPVPPHERAPAEEDLQAPTPQELVTRP